MKHEEFHWKGHALFPKRIKVPKQFYYWLKQYGIKPTGRDALSGKLYLKDKERHYRINCHGEFQASESVETFDRWANSKLITGNIPQSKADLDKFMELMKETEEHYMIEVSKSD